jgi:hypothetical protein
MENSAAQVITGRLFMIRQIVAQSGQVARAMTVITTIIDERK